LGLAAISHDPPEITAPFAERKGITYPLLNDAGSVVIRRYGILNTQVEMDQKSYGIPFPGTFILDTDGRVTARFFEESYRTRMTGSSLSLQLGIGAESAPDSAMWLSGDQLDVRVYSSDAVVAPGQEFTVLVDVTVKQGFHVYAPGEHPYRAIRLGLQPDSLFSEKESIYPEPKDYYFAPLDEHTPVYEGSFRILQPVVIEASRELSVRSKEPGATVTLQGVLEYQACDDKVCFLPESVPISITLGLRPLEP